MKTAAFITIHVGINAGSKLQTIATQEALKKVGLSPVCINYIPPRVTHKRFWKEVPITQPFRFLKHIFAFVLYQLPEIKYEKFLKKFCVMSKPIYAEDDFKIKCPRADFYISGSDQIWNYNYNEGIDVHYFFEGIEGKKIAFASSIGMSELPTDYVKYMCSKLKDYQSISVRESSAKELLAEWNIPSIHLLDPTFMLTKEEWLSFATKRLIKSPYLYVYLPYNTLDANLIYKSIRAIAEKKHLVVVAYSPDHRSDSLADKTIHYTGPGEFLSSMYYAEYVITNSFHGTAFSINFNKQFWAYMPSKFSSRLNSILELCGLQNRILDKKISDTQIDEEIDFMPVNEILYVERQKSLQFLTTAIN